MYYPGLKEVQQECTTHAAQPKSNERYTGIIPKNDAELPEARRQLGRYFRDVWHDNIAALEVELGLDRIDYRSKLHAHMMKYGMSPPPTREDLLRLRRDG